jgi:phosphatidyl-myo-inositol dimannoside synthase
LSRLLVVTNDFPPRRGGIESFVASLCRQLEPEELVVYTSTTAGADRFDQTLPYPVVRDTTRCLLPTPRVARTATDVVRRFGCDRVMFGAAAPLGLLAGALRAAGVRRLVGLTHGHEVWWARTPGTRHALRHIGEQVDTLTYVSEYCRLRIAAALSPAAAERMVRLAPGVDVSRFRPQLDARSVRRDAGIPANSKVVLAAARLVRRKGQDMLLRAWPAVAAAAPGTVLMIAGDGPDRRRLHRMASSLPLGDSVRFLPGVPWADMPALYGAADVFALPCRTRRAGLEVEALGIVYLEAAAAGLPVVVGRSGGAPETVVDGRTGYVVDPRRPDTIAKRILALLLEPARAAAFGAAGRARVATTWSPAEAGRILRDLVG